MNCKFFVAATLMLTLCGIALAEEFNAVITKVEDGKFTFTKMVMDVTKKKFEKADPATLPVSKNVKLVKEKYDDKTKKTEFSAIEGGLKNEIFKIDSANKNDKRIFGGSLYATIVTDTDNKQITEVRVPGPFNIPKK